MTERPRGRVINFKKLLAKVTIDMMISDRQRLGLHNRNLYDRYRLRDMRRACQRLRRR